MAWNEASHEHLNQTKFHRPILSLSWVIDPKQAKTSLRMRIPTESLHYFGVDLLTPVERKPVEKDDEDDSDDEEIPDIDVSE